MAPPAGKARQIGAVCVALVHKAARQTTGSRIEVFVTTPHRKIAAGSVQFEWAVAGSVGTVEADRTAPGVPPLRDLLHIEELPGVVIRIADQNKRDLVSLFLDDLTNIVHAQALFAVAGV